MIAVPPPPRIASEIPRTTQTKCRASSILPAAGAKKRPWKLKNILRKSRANTAQKGKKAAAKDVSEKKQSFD